MVEQEQGHEHAARLSDGRRILLRVYGAVDGPAVICLHGTPGSRLKFRAAGRAAAALGLRLIAPDRWGYGGTQAPPVPRLEAYPDDVAGIADLLGVGRFALLGVSGGGPFATVAAGALGDRVTRVGLVGPVGPMDAPGAALAGPFHRFCFRVLPRTPGALGLTFTAYRKLVEWAPDLAVQAAVSRGPPTDRAIMRDPAQRAALAQTFAAGFEAGSRGPVMDMELLSRDWRASPMPRGSARVWLGMRDGNVPIGPARRLASQLDADVVEIPDGGHFWIVQHYPQVLRWLAEA